MKLSRLLDRSEFRCRANRLRRRARYISVFSVGTDHPLPEQLVRKLSRELASLHHGSGGSFDSSWLRLATFGGSQRSTPMGTDECQRAKCSDIRVAKSRAGCIAHALDRGSSKGAVYAFRETADRKGNHAAGRWSRP